MIPDSDFNHLGLLSIVITWLGLLFLLYRWRGTKSMSFSLHAAQTKFGQIYYFCLFMLTLPLFCLFIFRWYVPTLNLPNVFSVLFIIGILGQILAITVPAIQGRKERIHNIGAYSMAGTLLPLTLIVSMSNIGHTPKLLTLLGVLIMISFGILFFVKKNFREYYLYFQAGYVAIFHAIILITTYTQQT